VNASRHSGFVIGSDTTPAGHEVWKVRVKEPAGPYDGRKLIVASVNGGVALAQGLNVTFVIGTMDGSSGSPELRAVDVRIQEPGIQVIRS